MGSKVASKIVPSRYLVRAGNWTQRLGSEMAHGGKIARRVSPYIKNIGTEAKLGGLNRARLSSAGGKIMSENVVPSYEAAEAIRYGRHGVVEGTGGLGSIPEKRDWLFPTLLGGGLIAGSVGPLINRKQNLLREKLQHKEKMERMRIRATHKFATACDIAKKCSKKMKSKKGFKNNPVIASRFM